MDITPYIMAERFKGIKEIPGKDHNPQIVAMLQRAVSRIKSDEVAWCSAFVGYICFLLGLPETKHLRARSWLRKGTPVELEEAKQGWDIVVLTRAGATLDPTVIDAPGHVGFYHNHNYKNVYLLGGNQSNSVNIVPASRNRILGVRRFLDE